MPSLSEAIAGGEDLIKADLSGAVEYGVNAPVGGPYLVEIGKVGRKSSNAGAPYVQFYASVVEGPHNGNRVPITWAATTENTGRLKTILRALGFDVDGPEIAVAPSAIKGRRAYVSVREQTDDDGNPHPKGYTECYDWQSVSPTSALD